MQEVRELSELVYRRRFIMRNSLMLLWRQSSPASSALCKLEARKNRWYGPSPVQRPENQGSQRLRTSSSPSQTAWEPGRLMSEGSWSRESKFLSLPFCSIQALKELDDAYPSWCWQPSLLTLLIQMLTSFWNTLSDTPRSNVLPALWASLSLVELTHKVKHHRLIYSEIKLF